jgi:hypothetical protein
MILNGCGGSTSGSGPGNPLAGREASEYVATLPDGSPMMLEVLPDSGEHWNGDFAVAAETGIFAFQQGVFEGSVKGAEIEATCETGEGIEFQLTGRLNSDGSLDLVRSDISSQTLHFVRQTAPKSSRANKSFILNTGLMTGTAIISDQPDSNFTGVKGYSGSWNGAFVRVWLYDSGWAAINVHPGNKMAVSSKRFLFKLVDFATKTTTVENEILYDCPDPVKRFTFKGSITVSPG